MLLPQRTQTAQREFVWFANFAILLRFKNFFLGSQPNLEAGTPNFSAVGGRMKTQKYKVPAAAVGAIAIGSFAVGALAVGALAIGRLVVGKASLGSLRIHDLTVDRLRVNELLVANRSELPQTQSRNVLPREGI
jgi:hypothetical protein